MLPYVWFMSEEKRCMEQFIQQVLRVMDSVPAFAV